MLPHNETPREGRKEEGMARTEDLVRDRVARDSILRAKAWDGSMHCFDGRCEGCPYEMTGGLDICIDLLRQDLTQALGIVCEFRTSRGA